MHTGSCAIKYTMCCRLDLRSNQRYYQSVWTWIPHWCENYIVACLVLHWYSCKIILSCNFTQRVCLSVEQLRCNMLYHFPTSSLLCEYEKPKGVNRTQITTHRYKNKYSLTPYKFVFPTFEVLINKNVTWLQNLLVD